MDLESICIQTIELSREVGKFINSNLANVSADIIEVKSKNSFVTYVDKTAEEKIVKGLLEIVPDAGFITEEETIENVRKEYTWVIDPLDGTTNFLHSLPPYSISIALMQDREVIMGVVLELCLNECFYTWKDGNAFKDGEIISVTKTAKIKDSLFATGFPYCEFSRLDEYMKLFVELMKKSQGVRRLGSAAVDLAYVACGRFEGFFEYGLSPWDVAAGTIIIKEAGGNVADFSGGDDFIFGKELIATNSAVYNEFLYTVNKYMPGK